MLLALARIATTARAQDIEPRAYSNAPVGVNFGIVGTVLTRGDLNFDASVPLTDAQLDTTSLVLAYARSLDLGGRSAKFDAIVPYTHLEGRARFQGQPIERQIDGFARPAFRLSVNLLGAPALTLREFADWKQALIVGVSLQVAPPWGQYDPTRLINIGSNRCSFKPELGVSKARGPWTLEVQAGVTFFTDNPRFFPDHTRAQAALYALQGHLIRGFRGGRWLSLDVVHFSGGRTTVDGVLGNDLQQNWRAGLIYAVPVSARSSLKLSASSGISARTGNNVDAVGVAWQTRWWAGL